MAEVEHLDGDTGNVYGAIDDDLDFQTVDNPYYGGEGNLIFENNRDQSNLGRENVEMISATTNIYYGL